ncbi:MAG TPA: nitrite reductase small subunit NirD [Bryobacteraceae bacterium]|nr:nitrite reductase small subunit NirD [Bryobacteraceae bacterium]
MTNEGRWIAVTNVESIPPREGRVVTLEGAEIAIFHVDSRYLAIANKCPHKGGPLGDGIVSGTTVVCPLHGRRFDLETGMAVRASEPACVATFPTRVENGIVFVNFSGIRRALDEAAA